MIEINCENCGKYLFTSDKDNKGAAASEATHKGYISKLPIFYGFDEFKIFCCKKCKDEWFGRLSEEVREKGNKAAKQLEADMLKDIPKLQARLARIQKVFNAINKSKI